MSAIDPPFANAAVAGAFARFAPEYRAALLDLRRLIFETAAETPQAGQIEETLKWGQPAYLTLRTKSGTTLRLGAPKSGGVAIFTHCQTSVMSEFRATVGQGMQFDGNRALHLDADAPLPEDALRLLIRRALTYRLGKRA